MKLNAGSSRPSGKPHAVVAGVELALREISAWPGVESVVAGRISKIKHRHASLSVTAQTSTVSGLKCLARTGQAVQELFVVTDAPAAISQRLRERWGGQA